MFQNSRISSSSNVYTCLNYLSCFVHCITSHRCSSQCSERVETRWLGFEAGIRRPTTCEWRLLLVVYYWKTNFLKITSHPHPYNSHANDDVHSYILERLQVIAQTYPFVHVDDDLRSNGSWAATNGVYFEGTNIVVKIDGTSSAQVGGVLFSAHYDSVSTAPGATDDGMGVATILQLVQYFANNRMKRTAVFNINNGEEDWLNGAHA